MTTAFTILKSSRILILKLIEDLTLEQLQTIPEGFNNNILWNVAHLVVTQQLLIYKLSGLNCLVSDEMIERYRKGAMPSAIVSETDYEEIKELFLGLPDTLQEDYEAGIFKEFHPYKTSVGFELDSLEKAIAFNNYHEGIHLGTIMALKKLI